jgi:histone acetyltransferase (RNA polymerase elongator complex component)
VFAPAVLAASTARPLVIPLFIPHMGCPHLCVFCNQRTISGTTARIPTKNQINNHIKQYLAFNNKPRPIIQVAFFGGNFLGLPETIILSLLEAVDPFVNDKVVDSIRFSTRPDTIHQERLKLLSGFPVSTVELGVQSMNNRVLEAAERGHLTSDTVEAVRLLKASGYDVGLQMMVGLPADDDAGAMKTAARIAALKPDFVRIYPTVVLKGSTLAQLYNTGRYHPMPLADCVTLVKRIFLYFSTHRIPVVRMGLQDSDGLTPEGELLAGPYHPAFGHLVHSEIALDAVSMALVEMNYRSQPLTITTHPAMVSRVQGLRKKNIEKLKQTFGLETVNLIQNASIPKDRLVVAGKQVMLR